MLVDSHCHLNFPELASNIDAVRSAMLENQVGHALLISVTLDKFPEVLELAERFPNFYATVGVHPDYEDEPPFDVDTLVALAKHPKVIGIGETGLDYFRLTGDLEWQRERFRTHIRAAIQSNLPLIIHTRSAAEDTLRIMREEQANKVGGVMHCFTESYDVAMQAIELGFYISFSGIVTFKNAEALKAVAQKVPLDRILV
ncbi:MAG: TatD family deoxyribonuclease, partial [Methylophilaceae bacterium]|nr:TatD family deoxyribonuclease [Methylophilaceae bacterium]